MSERMRMLLESRYVEEEGADDAEVEGMWSKALRTLRSSLLAGMDQDAAFTLVYQAALQVATAVVRAAGYRVHGDGHHHHTFAAAAAAGSGDLSAAARTSTTSARNAIRRSMPGMARRARRSWVGSAKPPRGSSPRRTSGSLPNARS